MDLIANLSLGFGVAFTPINLMYAFIGCLLGTLIGVLPGIGPMTGIALLIPITFGLNPDLRDHLDGGNLLRRDVRRLDHFDFGQHARRIIQRGDLH